MTRPRAIAVAVAFALVPGCYLSHERERAVDGGGDAAGVVDAAVRRDAGTDASRDATVVPDAAGCERIAGYRRCDVECPAPCAPADGRCTGIGVCRPRTGGGGTQDSCVFAFDRVQNYCSSGLICAPEQGEFASSEEPIRGVCMTAEFCALAPDARLPIDGCIYSDGTPFVTGPPAGPCPRSPRDDLPYCGGACGLVECSPPNDCLGVSDTRAFGFCGGAAIANCRRGAAADNALALGACGAAYGGVACECLVPMPQTGDAGDEIGFPVPRDVCDDYAAHHAGHARCVDASWSE